MATNNKTEVWLRGAVLHIPALLQPIAHALLQTREELFDLLQSFPDDLLWKRPAGLASAGFHLQHLTGVLDRLFTYAQANALSKKQLAYLANEGSPFEGYNTVKSLVEKFDTQVEIALKQLAQTDTAIITDQRVVGRQELPSTVIGLMVHAAEHTQRHFGQLLVTVHVVKMDV